MLQVYPYLLVVIAFIVLFPIDASNGVTLAWLWLLTRALNYYLMFRAYLMYLRLRSDFAKLGMPMPAFKFIPIWERDGSY
jgi:hypothetical protein